MRQRAGLPWVDRLVRASPLMLQKNISTTNKSFDCAYRTTTFAAMHDFAFIFAGFFVGIVVGLTGVGGGSLMTPILIFFFGVKPYLAVGTDLLFAAFTKMGGTVSLARQRLVPWRVVAHLCAGQHPGGLADTVCAAHRRPGRPGRAAGHDQHAGCGSPVDRRSHSVQGGSRQAGTALAAGQPTGPGPAAAPLGPAAAVRGR
jgi:hypothetical protein